MLRTAWCFHKRREEHPRPAGAGRVGGRASGDAVMGRLTRHLGCLVLLIAESRCGSGAAATPASEQPLDGAQRRAAPGQGQVPGREHDCAETSRCAPTPWVNHRMVGVGRDLCGSSGPTWVLPGLPGRAAPGAGVGCSSLAPAGSAITRASPPHRIRGVARDLQDACLMFNIAGSW